MQLQLGVGERTEFKRQYIESTVVNTIYNWLRCPVHKLIAFTATVRERATQIVHNPVTLLIRPVGGI